MPNLAGEAGSLITSRVLLAGSGSPENAGGGTESGAAYPLDMESLRIAGAQINLTVGGLEGNKQRILDAMGWAEDVGADVLLLPELAISGYPPEDLVLRPEFVRRNREIVEELAARAERVVTVIGFVDGDVDDGGAGSGDAQERTLANAAALISDGKVRGVYHKGLLPNYGVFDEERYFVPGLDCGLLWDVGGIAVGVSICEDIWVSDGPARLQSEAGAQVLLNINGSPYHRGKGVEREQMLSRLAKGAGLPLVYLNLVGGQDELVFDGESMVFDRGGRLLYRAAQFQEELFWWDVQIGDRRTGGVAAHPVRRQAPLRDRAPRPVSEIRPPFDEEEEIYQALVLGLGDYVRKNGFSGAVVGLSGGIDSALTAAIAADALEPDSVWGVTMPSRYSSPGSVDDSRELAKRLGIKFDEFPIEGVFSAYLATLAPVFEGTGSGVAEENLQARVRGAILMALSNKFGDMVVATGNKSELAVGYATLYGDMAGGFAVLRDVFKTLVYQLSEWRNTKSYVIPRSIIDKAPSAELRPDQKDVDSLPPYAELDPILERYIEQDLSVAAIIQQGFPPSIVTEVARMVDRNEYKRRQAAPGVKITKKAFGKDRRLPIVNAYGRRR